VTYLGKKKKELWPALSAIAPNSTHSHPHWKNRTNYFIDRFLSIGWLMPRPGADALAAAATL
jgi:hypothetical protein